jgi:hypothetical protein
LASPLFFAEQVRVLPEQLAASQGDLINEVTAVCKKVIGGVVWPLS